MKKILAVSGGIDSMVMLHLFRHDREALVAHFNHGTRPSSDADELFVAQAAQAYSLPFVAGRASLGHNPSEETARKARYAFLNALAATPKAEIYTAHHLSDLIESIAINLLRGTGWRGLTPLTLHRHPFLDPPTEHIATPWSKRDILKYAAENNITFRQDPTNTESIYLRNRLRQTLHTSSDSAYEKKVFSLWTTQKTLREKIETLSAAIISQNSPSHRTLEKSLLTTPPREVALELLTSALKSHHISLTRPQLLDLLNSIHTYTPTKRHNLPKNQFITINKSTLTLP